MPETVVPHIVPQVGDVWVPALIVGTLFVLLVLMCVAQYWQRTPTGDRK